MPSTNLKLDRSIFSCSYRSASFYICINVQYSNVPIHRTLNTPLLLIAFVLPSFISPSFTKSELPTGVPNLLIPVLFLFTLTDISSTLMGYSWHSGFLFHVSHNYTQTTYLNLSVTVEIRLPFQLGFDKRLYYVSFNNPLTKCFNLPSSKESLLFDNGVIYKMSLKNQFPTFCACPIKVCGQSMG